jgi:thioredoxin 2
MDPNLLVACPHCNTTNRVASARLGEAPACGHCKGLLLPSFPVELTSANFDRQVAVTELPLVVDFWAPWCAPCRMMAPAFEEAAARLAPRVRLGKLDTEAVPEVAARYAIRSIPTLIAFRGGREVARQSGAMGAPQLIDWIETHVASQ